MTEFNYANMAFSEIVSQIRDRLKNDPRFVNFNESAIAQTLMEVFAGVGDMANFYIERRAEENFLDTARLKSSVISLTKSIGYVPIRPIPANANLKIILKGPLPAGLVTGMTIPFNRAEVNLRFNGYNFLLSKTYAYTITSADVNNGMGNKDYRKVIEYSVNDINNVEINASGNIPIEDAVPINVLQAEYKTFVLQGDSVEAKPGQKFQMYNIDDKEFSDLYGSEDISYDYENDAFQLNVGYTKVGIGANETEAFEDKNLYEISRRSILTQTTTLNDARTSSVPNVCLIESKPNHTIKISFSDGNIATIGLKDSSQNLYVQYIATKGAQSNKIGVIDQKLSTNNTFTAGGSIDVTSNIEFRFNGNIIGGADFESIESMKQNAPGIFAALDRLTTKQDYVSYLKSLTSPIDVRNGLAWGEQEECEAKGRAAIKELFNVVLYSVLGTLYNISDTNAVESTVRRIDDTIGPETLHTSAVLWGAGVDYFKLNNNPLAAIGEQEALSVNDPITIMNMKLNRKGQITTRAYSLPPIIQYFNLGGKVYVNKLQSLDAVKKKVNNALYNYFDTQADFNVPIYKSNIIDIIESFSEVVYADVKFTEMDLGNNAPFISNGNSYSGGFAYTSGMDDATRLAVCGLMDAFTLSWLQSASNGPIVTTDTVTVSGFSFTNYTDVLTRRPGGLATSALSENNFWKQLAVQLYAIAYAYNLNSRTWVQSSQFNDYLIAFNCTLKPFLVVNLIDDYGNIVNYSLKQEIAAINISDPTFGLIYTYR